jgi:hypothetical protein
MADDESPPESLFPPSRGCCYPQCASGDAEGATYPCLQEASMVHPVSQQGSSAVMELRSMHASCPIAGHR